MALQLRTDARAVESLPLRLLVVAVVAGLSIVPAAGALDALRDRSFLDRCSVQLRTIVSTAELVAMEGIGAKRSMRVDLTSDGTLRATELEIGGGPGEPTRSSAILELSSGRLLICQADEPFTWLASPAYERLVTRSTAFTLVMTASESEGQRLVVCEVLPWTS